MNVNTIDEEILKKGLKISEMTRTKSMYVAKKKYFEEQKQPYGSLIYQKTEDDEDCEDEGIIFE